MKTTAAASAFLLLLAPSIAYAHASANEASQYFESNSLVSLISLLLAVGALVSVDLLSRRRSREAPRALARVAARSR